MALVPAGTSNVIRNVALSDGWSFEGKTRCAKFGWNSVAVPVGAKKKTLESWSPAAAVGEAAKWLTRTAKRSCLRRGRDGVITSSSPVRVHAARRPSTLTELTPCPAKSRSNLESAWVARAQIVTVPSTGCDGALVA